jgi:hypothetical protein
MVFRRLSARRSSGAIIGLLASAARAVYRRIVKTTSLLFLIAIPTPSWAQAVGPIDASQMPDGQMVVFNQSGLYTTGALATCGGAVEYLGLPNCPPSTTYIPVITSNISGNTGTNNWTVTNTTNTIPAGDTSGFRNTSVVVVFIVLDPLYYSQPHTGAFFLSSAMPAYVGGPQPSSIELIDQYAPLGTFGIQLPNSPAPGTGEHWYLKLTWDLGIFTPGSTVSFRAPVFTLGSVSSGPQINTPSPDSAPAGGPSFTMTVTGQNFVSGSTVLWNGTPLATSFVSANQLTALVPASLITFPGSSSVTVVNPGGANSNSYTFTITSAVQATPFLSSLSPNSVVAGGPSVNLTVNGSGFVLGATVLWNNSPLPTTEISAYQLLASVPASLVVAGGSANITVLNPGGAVSNGLIFSIVQPGSGPPTVAGLTPNSAAPGGPAFALIVTGTNFMNGAIVEWNSTPLAPIFQGSPTDLTALVPASLIANTGTAAVSVVNPNGTVSNFAQFEIGASPSLTVAQVADGASWVTQFQVINLDQTPINFAFQFWDDNGNPLSLPFVNGAAGTFSGGLAVGGTAFAETPGTAATLSQGWAGVTASGKIGVLTIFRQVVPGRPDSEGTVAALLPANHVTLPFDNTQGYATGVAVANTNPIEALAISLTFQTDTGAVSTGSLVLAPNAHTAFVLTSKFPALAGLRGSIVFSAATPDISIVGLRFSPTNSFTSLIAFQ